MTGTIFLGAAEYSVGEREPFVTVTIKRTGDLSGGTNITYQTNPGNAAEGADYSDTDGVVYMAPGQSSVTVNVPILNDSLSEPTEAFNFSIVTADSGTFLFPRTANISILDDENPVTPPAQPPLTSPYTVTTTPVISGLTQPMGIEWLPGSESKGILAEKSGVFKLVDIATGTQTTLLDIRSQVNANADRGLMDIALHPDFGNGSDYLYAFYTVDPPEASSSTGHGVRDGAGNRYAHLVRYEVDMSTGTPRIVADSAEIILGSAGRSYADISGNGLLNFTDPVHSGLRSSEVDAATGQFKQDYLKVDSQSHVGGAIAFGPDGALYVSTGDGTSFNYADPRTADVQNVNSLSGKILRIDPMTGEGFSDNPFATSDLDANASKVWQMGLRNPYTMAFAEDGRLFISETGWYLYEEINQAGPGANFGWPYYEGGDGGTLSKTPNYYTTPAALAFYAQVEAGNIEITPAFRAFHHQDAQPGYQFHAIVGASTIYTGDKYPGVFDNDYFFTDISDGEVYTLDINDRTKTQFLFDAGEYGPSNFIQGPDGYMYMMDILNGRLTRINITDPNAPTNVAPTVSTPIVDRNGTEDVALNFTLPANTFADADNDALVLTATLANGSPLPSWLAFNATTRTFTGTPTDPTGAVDIKVTATDPDGAAVSDTFRLTIANVNDVPNLVSPIAEQKASIGTAFSFALPTATFADADGDALALTARLANGAALPSWLAFNAATGTFSGTPPAGSGGTLVLSVRAQDPSGAAVTDYFAIKVGTNDPAPIVANPIDNQAATAGQAFSFAVPSGSFTDNGALSYAAKLASGAALPTWLTFNAATQTFTGTPPGGTSGKVNVTVTATDTQGSAVTDTFAINITGTGPVNQPPVVANQIADRTTAEGAALSFTLPANTFTDPEGASLTRTATLENGNPLPNWLTFNATTGAFTGTPDDPHLGTIAIRVTARDPAGNEASDVFNLTVTPVNDAPVLAAPIADKAATQGAVFSFALPPGTFTDVDSPELIYSARLANGDPIPSWLTFNSAAGTFTGTPGATNLGALDIVVTATDSGGLTATDTFRLTVASVPTGETLHQNNPTANQTITGTAPVDVFVLGANSSGYAWGATQDGNGIVIWNAQGHDILYGIETLRFTNRDVNIAVQGPDYTDDPDLVQHITGKTANDRFIIDGPSSAYRWGVTGTDSVVVWTVDDTDDTYDIVTGFEKLVFTDTSIDI